MPRTFIAFLIAPLVVPVMVVPYFATGLTSQWVGAIAFIAIIFSYLGTIVFGIPTYLLFRSEGWVSIWHTVATCIVGGWMLWFIFEILFSLSFGYGWKETTELLRPHLSEFKRYVWPSGATGAVYGLVFWLIARPDRTAVKKQNI